MQVYGNEKSNLLQQLLFGAKKDSNTNAVDKTPTRLFDGATNNSNSDTFAPAGDPDAIAQNYVNGRLVEIKKDGKIENKEIEEYETIQQINNEKDQITKSQLTDNYIQERITTLEKTLNGWGAKVGGAVGGYGKEKEELKNLKEIQKATHEKTEKVAEKQPEQPTNYVTNPDYGSEYKGPTTDVPPADNKTPKNIPTGFGGGLFGLGNIFKGISDTTKEVTKDVPSEDKSQTLTDEQLKDLQGFNSKPLFPGFDSSKLTSNPNQMLFPGIELKSDPKFVEELNKRASEHPVSFPQSDKVTYFG